VTKQWINTSSNDEEDETNTYMDMFFTKLRNLKPLVLDPYQTKINLPKEPKDNLSKLTELTVLHIWKKIKDLLAISEQHILNA